MIRDTLEARFHQKISQYLCRSEQLRVMSDFRSAVIEVVFAEEREKLELEWQKIHETRRKLALMSKTGEHPE